MFERCHLIYSFCFYSDAWAAFVLLFFFSIWSSFVTHSQSHHHIEWFKHVRAFASAQKLTIIKWWSAAFFVHSTVASIIDMMTKSIIDVSNVLCRRCIFFCTQFSLVKHHIAYFHWWLNTSTLLASIQQQLNTSFSSSWMIILSYTPNLKILFSFSCWPLNIQCDHTASPKTTTKIQFWWKIQMKKSNASILLELNISKYHHC